jgi:rhamnosyltransferase subunit B
VARLVLATMGSWGDLFPAIGLARAAAARGHTVSIATTPAYTAMIEAEQVTAVPVGPRFGPKEFAADPAILDGRQGGFAGFLHLFRSVVFPNLVEWVDGLRQEVAGADLLLSHPTVLASPIAAELTDTRWATFSVSPGLIPSAYTLPSPSRLPLPRGRVGRSLRRGAWRGARWNIARFFDPPVNAARAAVGLMPVRDSLFHPVASGNPYLVAASPHVIDAPPDWPPNVCLTGFVFWDSPKSFPPPSKLQQFLADGPAPVLITLGGSTAVDPQGFYPAAVAAVRRLGRRALVLTGPTGADPPLAPL